MSFKADSLSLLDVRGKIKCLRGDFGSSPYCFITYIYCYVLFKLHHNNRICVRLTKYNNMIKSGKYESEEVFKEHNPDKKIILSVDINRVLDFLTVRWINVKLKRIYYED